MNERIIEDISEFIFVSDEPLKSDIIFLPGVLTRPFPNAGQSCTVRALRRFLCRREE